MTYAGFRFMKALISARQGQPVTPEAYVYLPGIPGEDLVAGLGLEYFAVKVELGKNGAARVLPISTLSRKEEGLLEVVLRELRVNINTRISFVQ